MWHANEQPQKRHIFRAESRERERERVHSRARESAALALERSDRRRRMREEEGRRKGDQKGFKLIQRDKFMKRGYRDSRGTLWRESTLPDFMRFAAMQLVTRIALISEHVCTVS